ncbi:MAG: hypothetical protein IPF53_09320 [Blastocatellia bacterium]|nr:hypothetical protein [Blastocatellia bacterium]MBK6429107.1 hypothetical protein [Blastocatellia bacterium]
MHDSHNTVNIFEGRPIRRGPASKPRASREAAPDGDKVSHYERMARQAQLACRRAELEAERCRRELAHTLRVATIGELAPSIVHELNQPLTSVLMNACAAERFLAADSPNLDEVRTILRDIVDDDRRAGEVIRRLWTLLKSGSVELLDVDLNLTVAEIGKLVGSDAALRGVTVEFELVEGLPSVRGDRIQLQQVVLNLVVNGMDAMRSVEPRKRRLTIRTLTTDRQTASLEVCDSGIGIDVARLDQVFQPYFTTKRDGLGMGLSIARSIVEAHGGRLWATNNTGPGATFSLTLPLKKGRG